MDTKVISARLPADLATQLSAVARIEGVSVSETIRAASHHYIAVRRSKADFKDRLRRRLEEDREVMEQLAE